MMVKLNNEQDLSHIYLDINLNNFQIYQLILVNLEYYIAQNNVLMILSLTFPIHICNDYTHH